MNKILKIILIIFFSFFYFISSFSIAEEKIKIGLLVPITGTNKQLGQQIIKSSRIALKDLNTKKIEIYLKNTNSNQLIST